MSWTEHPEVVAAQAEMRLLGLEGLLRGAGWAAPEGYILRSAAKRTCRVREPDYRSLLALPGCELYEWSFKPLMGLEQLTLSIVRLTVTARRIPVHNSTARALFREAVTAYGARVNETVTPGYRVTYSVEEAALFWAWAKYRLPERSSRGLVL